jgi:hypothetical protein
MACSCKSKKNGQVTAVKQVAKKNVTIAAAVKPSINQNKKRVMYKRPI